MINSIVIKNVTSYDMVGATVSDLKKVNFFFGNNGSGKSTVAKYLYNLSLDDEDLVFRHCVQNGYDSNNNQILVFNEDFITRNFISQDTQMGIFSLNQKNEEIDEKIKSNQEQLEKLGKKILHLGNRNENIQNNKEKKFEDIKKSCFEVRKTTLKSFPKIKDSFPHKQTKNNFESIQKQLLHQPLQYITFDMLLENYKKYYDEDLVQIKSNISIDMFDEIIAVEELLENILQKVIVGNSDVDIAKMIDTLNNKRWVEEGRSFLKATKDLQICPFCQKETIDSGLIVQFEQYFDETYKNDIHSIEQLKNKYSETYGNLRVNLQSLLEEFNVNNVVSNLIENLKEVYDKNIKTIDNKLDNSNEKKEIESIDSLKGTVEDINSSIENNNEAFQYLDQNKEKFFQYIWSYLALESKNEIETFAGRENKYKRLFETIKTKIDDLKDTTIDRKKEIEELRDQTISTGEAVENINVILRNSGFEGFSIEEKELNENNISEYYLKRDNGQEEDVFKTLSEGEKNFIAFLYFYQLCLGGNAVEESEKKKIIVIDDPVSSLDSQVLFIVNSLIHHLITRKGSSRPDKREFKNTFVEQVFILTHNIYFHKEVSYPTNLVVSDKARAFFTIKKVNAKSDIVGNEKPIVNDYFLLWDTLKTTKEIVTTGDTTHNISITNLMRRILESYVNFTGLGNSVWNAVQDVDPEDPINIICSSLVSELQDGSHKVSPLDEIYFTRVMNEEAQKLFDVFEIIFNEIGKDHYMIMMGVDDEE